MGYWDVGPFDNTPARDLIEDIHAGRFNIEQFKFEVAGDTYLDADDAAVVLALGALIFRPTRQLPDGLTRDDIAGIDTQANKEWIKAQLPKVFDEETSELYSLWEYTGEVDRWKEYYPATCTELQKKRAN